jgi:hypothetical protein
VTGVLFIDPGPVAARVRLFREGRGDWAQALPVVLEKYGYPFDIAGPEALRRDDVFDAYAAILVPRLLEPWTADLAQRARAASGAVIVEGPPDPALANAVDVFPGAGTASRDGILSAVSPELVAAATRYWHRAAVPLGPPQPVGMKRDGERAWQEMAQVFIAEDQARAWAEPSWDAVAMGAGPDAEILAEWTAEGGSGPSPGIVRRAGLVMLGVSLLSFLAQRHSSPPFVRGTHFRTPRVTGGEALLLGLLDLAHRRARRPRPRLLPWPGGAAWVRNVRHDFDRPIDADATRDVLAGHAREGTRATWYFRAGFAGSEALRLVAGDDSQEVALHSELLWQQSDRERASLEHAVGRPIVGVAAHGGAAFFGYQGAPNQLWAHTRGLRYTELLQHGHFHPHRFPVLGADGAITTLDVLCMPQHESFDWSTKQGHHRAEAITAVLPDFLAAGGMVQLMNHPDLNILHLFDYLRGMPQQGRLDLTARDAADWWRRTHTRERLVLRADRMGATLVAADRVDALVVEVLTPDGGVTHRTVNLEPGRTTRIT